MTSHLIQRRDLNPSLALIAIGVFSEPIHADIGLKIRDVDLKLCQLPECEPVIAARDSAFFFVLAFTQKKDAQYARANLLYWNGWGKLEAIRLGKWKLYLSEVKDVAGSADGPVLFDIQNDPAETSNVAASHTGKVKEMTELATRLSDDIKANSIPLGESNASP